MDGKQFFDTNILIYAVAENDSRAERARELLAEGGLLSVQVLNEFVAVARRKYKMTWADVSEALTDFRVLCPGPVYLTLETHETALQIAGRYGYGIYDSLVIASASESTCKTLYSEDMQDGQKIGSVTIRNPFL